ncbi:MAG: glycerol-3-phosphate acyltransferase [Caldilineaceae bacterium]|nr:glycerol-3-phosphate acyltransferase [Caldilineaceae bacterium]
MNTLLLAFFAFWMGTLPFSVWVGRLVLGKDIRHYGDANPGATNVLRAGGKGAAAVALLLDFVKGALPVALAHFSLKLTGAPLILIALLPVLGHAFSPFLRGRGGKAVATTGGIWSGLTSWEGPTVGGLLLGVSTYLLGANGWAVLSAVSGMLCYLWLTPATWNGLGERPTPLTIGLIGLGNLLILAWKHRADLRHPPRWRGKANQHSHPTEPPPA